MEDETSLTNERLQEAVDNLRNRSEIDIEVARLSPASRARVLYQKNIIARTLSSG
jgi:hypothetical protein